MGLESATYISGLNANNPVNLTDIVGEGDDHIRLVKSCLLNTFPNITGAMTMTHTQLNNAAVKNEANVFSTTQEISTSAVTLYMNETDAAVDNRAWRLRASNEAWSLQMQNDARSSTANIMQVQRTANVIDSISFFGPSRFYDSGATDYLELSDNDSASLIGSNVNPIEFRPQASSDDKFRLTSTQVQVTHAAEFVHFDSDNSAYMYSQHDGTDYNTRFLNTTDWNIDINQALTGQIKVFADVHLVTGSQLQIRDTTNSDTITIYHTGTHAQIDFVQTASVIFGGPSGRPNDYYYFDAAGPDSRIYLREDGADQCWFRHYSGGTEIRGLAHGDPIVMIAENAGGTARTLLSADPDTGVAMYYPGVGNTALITADHTAADEISGARVRNADGDLQPVGLGVMIDDPTSWGSGTVTPFNQDNVGESIEQDNASGTNYDTHPSTGSAQTNIPNGAWWFVTVSVANTTTIRGGTGVTLRVFKGDGSAVVDADAIIPRGSFAVVRKASDTVYEVYPKTLG